jgi:hypothetical protein
MCSGNRYILPTTKNFELRWGPGEDELINSKILADDEHINEDPLEIPNSVGYIPGAARDIELSEQTDLNDLFFVQFFPSVVEHAKITDEFHADDRSPFHNAVVNDKI